MGAIESLFEIIEDSNSSESVREEALLELVDSYKDVRIIPFLIHYIESQPSDCLNGTIIFACHEYSVEECVPFLEIFINIILDANFEAAWAATSLLDDMRCYFNSIEEERLINIYHRMHDKLAQGVENEEFVRDAISMIEEDIIIPKNFALRNR